MMKLKTLYFFLNLLCFRFFRDFFYLYLVAEIVYIDKCFCTSYLHYAFYTETIASSVFEHITHEACLNHYDKHDDNKTIRIDERPFFYLKRPFVT